MSSFYLNQWLARPGQGSRQAGGIHCSDLCSRVSAFSAQPILGEAQSLLGEVPGHGAWVSFLEGPLQGRTSKSRGEGKLGLSPKEVSLVTGNEAETICRLLSLVGPVFTRVDDSLTPQEPPLLPALLCKKEDLSQEKTVPRRLGGSDASAHPAPSTCPLSLVCTAGACGRRGGEQVLMRCTGGKSSERKGAGLEEAGPRRHRMWSVREQAALLFCELIPSPTSGLILLSGPQEQVQGTSGTWATGQCVQGTRWFRKSWGNRRRAST